MAVFFQDVRYAFRTLRKNPSFAITAVITLALAIGVNTAMFSLVNAAVLAPLPFEDADRLVRIFRQSLDGSETNPLSYLDYVEYRDRNDAFEELFAFSMIPTSVGIGNATEARFGQVVTGNYFTALGVEAFRGRVLTPDDDHTPGAHPVVVLSYPYWQRAFGGRPDAVGESITLGGNPFTVIGVAPPGFAGALPIPTPDMWMPITMIGQIRSEDLGRLEERDSGFLLAIGKLKPGLSMAQAQARMDVVAAQLTEVDPDRYDEEHPLLVPSTGIIPMTPGMRQTALAISALIMCMVGLILVVACANVANLLLARSTARRREIGIRLAIGAGRWRLARQLLTESTLLGLVGGAVGLLLAVWSMDLLVASLPRLPFNVSISLHFGVDHRMLAFTLVASLLAGILFGLVPAFGAARVDVVSSLKDDLGAGGFGVRRSRLRDFLVIGQVAISLLLLVGAGLFVRSLLHAHAIDPGFKHKNVLAVALDMGARDYDAATSKAFLEQILGHSRVLPGVASASIETCPPLTMTMSSSSFWIEDRPYLDPEDERVGVALTRASAGNFETLDIPLLRGRDFTEQDTGDAPGVAIVNQAFVQRFWPDQDPIGKRISSEGPKGPYQEVVGVASTVKYWLIGEKPRPFIYFPLSQSSERSFATLLVRTRGDPMTALSPVRAAMNELDPDMFPMNTQPLSELIGFALLPARFAAALFGLFGVLALLLASVGLFGVMSYSVSQRTHEIGIRATLGAQRGDIVRLVLKQGLTLTAIGLVIGLIVSMASSRVLSSLLYDISATDPLTFVGVSLVLVAVGALACYLPARRATKVDPVVALRNE